MNRTPRIAVLGSINMDLVIRCAKLPMPGETLMAESAMEIPGGKGANQAVAAARAGGEVTMIGRVGDDAFAGRLLANLQKENINCDWVQQTPNCASGLAIVAVEDSGQNSILVVPGSNGRVSVADAQAARSVIESSDVLLLQLEIPIETVLAGIEIAHAAGVRIILDPAPAPKTFPTEMLGVDLLCPNETEAAAIVGSAVESMDQIESAAQQLHKLGVANVAITLGEKGTLLYDGEKSHVVESFKVDVVDTTAAGDAFAGAMAVSWIQQGNLVDAARFANAAGGLAASREGAQIGMASRDEIEALCKSQ